LKLEPNIFSALPRCNLLAFGGFPFFPLALTLTTPAVGVGVYGRACGIEVLAGVRPILPSIHFCSVSGFVFLPFHQTFRCRLLVADSLPLHNCRKLRSIQLRNCRKLRKGEFEDSGITLEFYG